MRAIVVVVTGILLSACSEAPLSAVEHGSELFFTRASAGSSTVPFSCATCHRVVDDPADVRFLPGADLRGATARPTFWGGQEVSLLAAINDCRTYFQSAPTPWTPDDEDARAMYAYLVSLPSSLPAAQPFTVRKVASDLPRGDATQGADIYRVTCKACHGATHSGAGRLSPAFPVLPEQSVASFHALGLDATNTRIAFIEKIRHGGFLGLDGNMPPYSIEALTDGDIANLVTYLDLHP